MPTISYTQLSDADRETLSLGLAHGQSLRAMAMVLGRASSPVSRESARNTARGRPHRACPAQTRAAARAHHPRRPHQRLNPWLWQYVQTHLAPGCSPEQIAGRLRRAYPDNMRKHLSAETIYVALLCAATRSPMHRTAGHTASGAPPAGAGDRPTRPDPPHAADGRAPREVATRTGPGHWEGALITGARHGSAVGTLVERTTRLVLLARLEGPDARRAREGFTKKLRPVPALLRKTLTDDRGNERAEHERLAQRLKIQVFIADPHSPWQRGTNKITDGLLRHICPKAPTCRGTRSASGAPSPLASIPEREHVSIGPHPWRSIRPCVIIHPLHVKLDTAQ